MKKMHVFPSQMIEVGTGGPGYRWVQGYSEVSAAGVSNAMTLANLRAQARRDGQLVTVHPDEASARKAVAS